VTSSIASRKFARRPTACFEMRCHSDPERSEGEESRPGLLGAVCPTQNKIPRSARNDISWFLGVRRLPNMSDCFENRGAGETPAPHPSTGGPFSWFPGALQWTNKSDSPAIGVFTPSTPTQQRSAERN
jgi:hypothetical protein